MTPLDKMSAALALSQSGEDCFSALLPEAQESLRENVRAVLASAWQPIETAPEDGLKVLCCGQFRAAYTNWAWEPLAHPVISYFNNGGWVADAGGQYSFSHWMPTPPLPGE